MACCAAAFAALVIAAILLSSCSRFLRNLMYFLFLTLLFGSSRWSWFCASFIISFIIAIVCCLWMLLVVMEIPMFW